MRKGALNELLEEGGCKGLKADALAALAEQLEAQEEL